MLTKKRETAKQPQELMGKSKDIPVFIMPKNVTECDIPQDILSFVKDNSAPLLLFYGSIKLKGALYDLYDIEDVLELCAHLEFHKVNFRMLILITYNSNDTGDLNFIKKIVDAVSYKKNIMLVKSPKFPIIPIYKYTRIYLRPTKTDGDSLAVREAIQMNCTPLQQKHFITMKL